MKHFILLLLLLCSIHSLRAQKQKLELNLKVGETYHHSMHSSTIVTQEVEGQRSNVDVSLSGKIAFKVNAVVDTVYDMSVRYEQFGMTLRVQGREMSFSSENPRETDVLSKMLAAMTGQYFTVKMTRLGKLLVVENLDQLFETVVEQMAGVTPEQKQQSKEQMLRSYGEKAFKGSFETITNIYSNSAVEKGDTWSIDTKLESVAAATLKTTFKFEGMVDGYHQIVGTGRFETLDKDAYSDISGMPTKYHLSGTATSAFKLDAATGWIIEGTVAQSLSGNAEIKDNPDLRGGLTIPMSIESKLEYRSH